MGIFSTGSLHIKNAITNQGDSMSTQSKIDEIQKDGVYVNTNCDRERSGHSPIVICRNKQNELTALYRVLEQEQAAQRRLKEQEVAAKVKAEADRLKLEQEVAAKVKAEAERLKLEQEAAAKAKAEADRIAKEAAAKAEAQRLAKEAADKAEAERLKLEQEAAAKAKAEADRIAKEAAAKAKAEADRIAKEAADKAEAQILAKEIADKVEAERLAKEAAAKAKAEAERLAKEAADKAEAEKLEREAKIKAEELAEKLIAEAKDIIANAGHEREIINPKLLQLLKDKKLEDLEQYLKSAREKDMNIVTTLEKFKKFNGEYNLNEGSKILSQFNAVKEEIITESKEQLSFIAEIQRYTKNIKLDTEMIDLPNYEKEGILQEINTKTTEYHDHGEEL